MRMSVSVGLIIMLLFSCSDKTDPVALKTDPEIKRVRVTPNWNLAATVKNIVEAEIYDPQGVGNIESVTVTIKNSAGLVLLSDSLYDDGAYYYPEDGDVIAGDGVYRNQFDAASDVATIAGDYHIEINVTDRDGNMAEQPGEAMVSFGYSYPAEFRMIEIPDTLKSGSEDRFVYVTLYHQKGISAIEEVRLQLYNTGLTALLQEVTLRNDGDFINSGDIAANDSVFSFRLKNSFAAGRKGDYKIKFQAVDEFGQTVQTQSRNFYLENESGSIIQTDVPDQMQRPSVSGTFTIGLVTASVLDPQGLTDVDSVYFYSKRPDGQMANSGLPLVMVDNGKPFNFNNLFDEAGDEVANDGTYSLSIVLDSNAQAGVYEFSFYMRDKVGHLSQVLVDSVEVF